MKDAVGLIITMRCEFGNTRKASMKTVTVSDNQGEDTKAKERLKLSKQLIVSKEYEAIKSFQGAVRTWVYSNTVPSFFKEGFQLVSLTGVEGIEQRLQKAQKTELPELVKAFQKAYPAQVEAARAVLGPVAQFNSADYPQADSLPGLFDVEWFWVNFQVANGLPAELAKLEQDKLEKRLTDAGDEIIMALRASFADLITHANEKLTPSGPGEKPKVFRDSLVGNITDFIGTFNQRDILGDIELMQLVNRAGDVLRGVTPQKLRDLPNIREQVRGQFTEIKAKLDTMLTERPSRKFDFTE
jgi:hypothetical protein